MVLRGAREGIEKQFYELCSQVVSENGYDLYDLEYFPRNQELRLFIMDPETGSAIIEDCVKIDMALTPYIDELEWMPDELRLEVSSPGIFRGLTTVDHFNGAEGEQVELQLAKKLVPEEFDGLPKKLLGEKKLKGVLVNVVDDGIELDSDGFKLNLKYEQIKKANMSPDL